MPKQSPNEAKKGRGSKKKSKKLVPTATVVLEIEKTKLPAGAVLSSFEERYVQDLKIETVVTLYKRARYRLPDGKYIYADMPKEITSSYGPGIKQYILHQSQACNVSEAKIHKTLLDIGIQISEGEISNILIEEAGKLEKEYQEVAQTGIETAEIICTDDTSARHKHVNAACLVIQNQFFAYFKTSASKSRKNFLQALRVSHIDYVLNEASLAYIKKYNPKDDLLNKLQSMLHVNCKDESAWKALLEKHNINEKNTGKIHLKAIEEAALLGSAIEHGLDRKCVIMSDGAQQYNVLIHALCWVHAERAIKKLIPKNDAEVKEIDAIRDQIWKYYDKLNLYREQEARTLDEQAALRADFDVIFTKIVVNDDLSVVLRKFIQRKDELLRVLENPNVPLHNNSSEQDIRHSVIKRKISGSTRSDAGCVARDIYMSLIKTCRKHALSTWNFFGDRLRQRDNTPYLPNLIRKKAALRAAGP